MCVPRSLFRPAMASGAAKPSKHMKTKVDNFAVALTKKGIKLLAVDFDQTLLDIHSSGVWVEGIDKLATHVRPCMRDLLEAAVHKGVYVAIVTYFRQPLIIQNVLQKVLSKKVASKVYVQINSEEFMDRIRTKSLKLDGSCKSGSMASGSSLSSVFLMPDLHGKEFHIASVINDIKKDHGVTILKDEVLLMDDDIDNVRTAITFGHLAFHIQQTVDYDSFDSFQTMLLL